MKNGVKSKRTARSYMLLENLISTLDSMLERGEASPSLFLEVTVVLASPVPVAPGACSALIGRSTSLGSTLLRRRTRLRSTLIGRST
jgi:hypothetical protein